MLLRAVRHLLLVALLGLALPLASVWAADEEAWAYRVSPRDTLIGLAATYLQAPGTWQGLQRLNRIADPLRLVPGSTLRIPVAWLRRTATVAEVLHVQGDVVLSRGGAAPQPVAPGSMLRAGDGLRTGPAASVTLRFADGSRLLAAPDSQVTIERLLVYGRSGIPDTRLRLDRGSVDSQVVPQPGRSGGYEIRTPTVNLGVRGTQFRAHADEGTATARVEVLEGAVAAEARQATRVGAGFGTVAVAGQPIAPPRRLIAAPDLGALPPRQERIPLRFAWPSVAGAQGYRAQVYPEGSDDRLLLDARGREATARWPDLPDGRYRLRVRAIDEAGLEGLDASAAFVLKARPEPPFTSQPAEGGRVYGDAVELGWTRSGSAARYRLQLADAPDFVAPRVEADGIDAVRKQLTLPPGRYHWRVASVAADGDVGPWSDAQSFTLKPVPPSPAAEPPQVDDSGLVFRWKAGEAGESFDYQVARDAEFRQLVDAGRSAAAQVLLKDPKPGRYHLRVRTVDADGYAGPYGATQQVDVPYSRWWWLLPPAVLLLFL